MKRSVLAVLSLVVLVCLAMSSTYGQIPGPGPGPGPSPGPMPLPSVRGCGAIAIPNGNTAPNLGTFEINVVKQSNGVFGGVKYMEITPTGQRKNVIYSWQVTSLDITGNKAVVKATGVWNNMPCAILVEATDDNVAGDTFHIVATPKNGVAPYDQGGPLVKGDIVVTNPQAVPINLAQGAGAIAVGTEGKLLGMFNFKAQSCGEKVMGCICYNEVPAVRPTPGTPIPPPGVKIYCPAVTVLVVDGNKAILSGNGFYNGQKALIEVTVEDNAVPSPTPPNTPDVFNIKATPAADVVDPLPVYEAGGPLVMGDVVVKTITPP